MVETVLSTEDRLQIVEKQLESVQEKMEIILSKLVGRGTEGSPGEAITKGDVQAVVEELKDPESESEVANAGGEETTSTTTADK